MGGVYRMGRLITKNPILNKIAVISAYLITSCLCIHSAVSQTTPDTRSKYKEHRIKIIVETEYQYNWKGSEYKSSVSSEQYDTLGNLVRSNVHTDDESVKDILNHGITYTYDEYGNITSEEKTSDWGNSRHTYSHKYTPDGRVATTMATYFFGDDNRSYSKIYKKTYNDEGKLVMHVTVDVKDPPEVRQADHYVYDERKRKRTAVWTSGLDDTLSVTNFTYNEKDQLVKKEVTMNDGSTSVTELTYDEQGRVLQESGPSFKIHYKYNDNGLLIEMRKEVSEKPYFRREYQYFFY
jgi:YD repeat-containing protein